LKNEMKLQSCHPFIQFVDETYVWWKTQIQCSPKILLTDISKEYESGNRPLCNARSISVMLKKLGFPSDRSANGRFVTISSTSQVENALRIFLKMPAYEWA
jgi:hypothetical protein